MTKEASVLLYTSDFILVPTSCESSRLLTLLGGCSHRPSYFHFHFLYVIVILETTRKHVPQ
jgi:hypothetical protein